MVAIQYGFAKHTGLSSGFEKICWLSFHCFQVIMTIIDLNFKKNTPPSCNRKNKGVKGY
jgi:hypothetical protein